MKRMMAILMMLALACALAACGAQEPARETTTAEQTAVSSVAAQTETEAPTTAEQTTAGNETTDPQDWKTAYTEYLRSLTDESDHVSALEYVKYAFVSMPELDCPVLVLFGGWRDFSFYTFRDGKMSVVQEKDEEDGKYYDLLEAWVDEPVYDLDGKLYFCGSNGAPATVFMNEVAVQDGTLRSERVAAVTYASAFGDRDYYYGRGEAEITESEYTAIVEPVKVNGTKIEFLSLQDLKG